MPATLELLAKRDAAIKTAADHADAVTPSWSDRAYDLFIKYAKNSPKPFLTEEAREFAEAAGLPPAPDPRAWGSVARRAVSANAVRKVGYGTTSKPPAHPHPKALWEANPRLRR